VGCNFVLPAHDIKSEDFLGKVVPKCLTSVQCGRSWLLDFGNPVFHAVCRKYEETAFLISICNMCFLNVNLQEAPGLLEV
jgi:hypothetical protein